MFIKNIYKNYPITVILTAIILSLLTIIGLYYKYDNNKQLSNIIEKFGQNIPLKFTELDGTLLQIVEGTLKINYEKPMNTGKIEDKLVNGSGLYLFNDPIDNPDKVVQDVGRICFYPLKYYGHKTFRFDLIYKDKNTGAYYLERSHNRYHPHPWSNALNNSTLNAKSGYAVKHNSVIKNYAWVWPHYSNRSDGKVYGIAMIGRGEGALQYITEFAIANRPTNDEYFIYDTLYKLHEEDIIVSKGEYDVNTNTHLIKYGLEFKLDPTMTSDKFRARIVN